MKRAKRLTKCLALLPTVFLLVGCKTLDSREMAVSEAQSISRQTVQTPAPSLAVSTDGENTEVKSMTIQVGDTVYTVTLCQNETSKAFAELLPLQAEMQELNGNEKYIYLGQSLPEDPGPIGSIHAGDLMLFGSDCVVLFYKDFSTHYQYTRIGHLDTPDGLAQTLGTGTVSVTFQPVSEP